MKKIYLVLLFLLSIVLTAQNVRVTNSYTEDLASGRFEGRSYFWKFGEGSVGTTETTICSQGEDYTYPDEAIYIDLVSTETTDSLKVLVFSGLDQYWKQQSETILMQGTTPVTTTYKYLRVTRIECISDFDGEIQATETGLTGSPYYALVLEGRGRTQQSLFSVPAGHTIFIHGLEYSSYNNKKTNIEFVDRDYSQADSYSVDDPGFRVVINSNIINQDKSMHFEYPFPVSERQDIEARGYTETGTDTVTAMMFGSIVQNNSIPVDVSGFTITPSDSSMALSWTELTPSESQDQRYFKITVDDGSKVYYYESEVGSTVYYLKNLTNDIEYTVTIQFVGYDGLLSDGVTETGTPTE